MSAYSESPGAGRMLVRAFSISIGMALLMMLMAFGFMYIFTVKYELPVSFAIVLMAFAISFIASSVLLNRIGAGSISSLIGGAAMASGLTILLVAAGCGIYYINASLTDVGADTLLAGFAACLIVSMVINSLTLRL